MLLVPYVCNFQQWKIGKNCHPSLLAHSPITCPYPPLHWSWNYVVCVFYHKVSFHVLLLLVLNSIVFSINHWVNLSIGHLCGTCPSPQCVLFSCLFGSAWSLWVTLLFNVWGYVCLSFPGLLALELWFQICFVIPSCLLCLMTGKDNTLGFSS